MTEDSKQAHYAAADEQLQKGDYVLATKYDDGDTGDEWCVGIYDSLDGDRHMIIDDKGQPFRSSGFRKAARISHEYGSLLVANKDVVQKLIDSLWDSEVIVRQTLSPKPALTRKTNPADMSVGEIRADGTIYLGEHLDPKDGLMKDWFTTAEDAKFEGTESKSGERLELNFNQAAAYVKKLEAHGNNDWQVATDNILVAQFDARNTGAFTDTYDHNRNFPRSRYLSQSLTQKGDLTKAIARSFVDGKEELIDLGYVGFLRPVRSAYAHK